MAASLSLPTIAEQQYAAARAEAADVCERIGAALAHRGADHVEMRDLLQACTKVFRAKQEAEKARR